jgi:hypothetical protein
MLEGSNVYYGYEKLNQANINSFQPVDDDWGKDNDYYYWYFLRLDSLEYTLVKVLSPDYIKDSHNVIIITKK